jgi:hypothetical protein
MNRTHTSPRAAYFRLLMEQRVEWLRACLAQPTAHMRKRHTDLIRLAIRKKEGAR